MHEARHQPLGRQAGQPLQQLAVEGQQLDVGAGGCAVGVGRRQVGVLRDPNVAQQPLEPAGLVKEGASSRLRSSPVSLSDRMRLVVSPRRCRTMEAAVHVAELAVEEAAAIPPPGVLDAERAQQRAVAVAQANEGEPGRRHHVPVLDPQGPGS
ncbi:MAG: hypothetical protein ER33_09885 [Cyanobium sp. CACIAM 14]|nr:MAG: hypothetical protein ER33_09885 [Cyanobium sp. CACIAM 14]